MDEELRSGGKPDQRSLDAVVGLLASRRRRHVLRCLASRTDDTTDLDALVEYVRERERSRTDGLDRRAVLADLHHVHLPRLVDERIVEYDPDRRRVRYLGAPLVETLLEEIEPYEAVE